MKFMTKFEKFMTKLEFLFLLLLILLIYLIWEELPTISPIKIFDFCMASFCWAFVSCCYREEKIESKKISREEAERLDSGPLITIYDCLVLFIIIFIYLK